MKEVEEVVLLHPEEVDLLQEEGEETKVVLKVVTKEDHLAEVTVHLLDSTKSASQ
jgi:hypothetical protein